MTHLTVSMEQGADFTVLSNRFVDEYMLSANAAQIKIYLYLLRMTGANLPFNISDIADRFNYMEQDVLRALSYWEKCNLLALDFDGAHNIKGIRILPIPVTHITDTSVSSPISVVDFSPASAPISFEDIKEKKAETVSKADREPHYSSSELMDFRTNNETSQIIFIAETYTGKPLSPSDLQSLLFIYDKLGFSTDLIDYLLQYCVSRGKKHFSYIQKVAIDWADSHITTIEEAKNHTGKYDKSVYTIMKALGKNTNPTDPEIAFINKWSQEWGFSLEIILNACNRTVLSTDNHRFEYTDGILKKWHNAKVKSLSDIEAVEANHSPKKPSKPVSSKSGTGFNDFHQRTYDFKALEKALRSN